MSGVAGKLQHARSRARGVGSRAQALQFLRQDFKALKRACLHEDRLFVDETFKAAPCSLGFQEFGPESHKTRGVTWQRPKELTPNPEFIVKEATRTDIRQGILGDCGLLAAIASLTLNQEVLADVVPPGQSFEEDYAGIFHFQFWHYGEWVDVVIDDQLPTRNGKLLFVHSEQRNEFWSALLEKAYAKLHGCYEALIGVRACEASEDFTGGITEGYKLKTADLHLFSLIQRALGQGSLLGCFSQESSSDTDSGEVNRGQLVKNHAYSVTGAAEVAFGPAGRLTCKWPFLCERTRPEMVRLIRIRNPWGEVEWTGPWSDGSEQWMEISRKDRARLRHKAHDGEFWMSFSDFLRHCTNLEICHLTPHSLSDDAVKGWRVSTFEGSWRRGSTAGGCRDFLDTFWMNPQFMIKLKEEDDDPDDGQPGCSFMVALVQKNRRQMKKTGEEMLTIGFTIYKFSGKENIRLHHKFFLTQQMTARSETFINTREVSSRFRLPPGEYAIIPSTYKPNLDGDFCLRVFSETQAEFHELDDQVKSCVKELKVGITQDEVDGQFLSLLRQHAGEVSGLSAFELRSFLNKALTECTDVQAEGFSLQSCRSMVNLLDDDGSGKLSLVELKTLWDKIQGLMNIYKKKDVDESGTMSSTEMRQAVGTAVGCAACGGVLAVLGTERWRCSYCYDMWLNSGPWLELLEPVGQVNQRFYWDDTQLEKSQRPGTPDPGFSLNNSLHQILVARYSQPNLTIHFAEFVGCLVRLELMFSECLIPVSYTESVLDVLFGSVPTDQFSSYRHISDAGQGQIRRGGVHHDGGPPQDPHRTGSMWVVDDSQHCSDTVVVVVC
ncbi:hypothetical protein NFI96_023012 [Prochilodus magdalenae]|nr:hypothetical protein NFI96_023012 [Prochilodus magdalenae]